MKANFRKLRVFNFPLMSLLIVSSFQNCAKSFEVMPTASESTSTNLASSALSIQIPESGYATKDDLVLIGSCRTGSPVQIKGDVRSPMTVACSNGQFQQVVTLSAGDGTKNVIISQIGSSGETISDSRNFVLDTSAPSLKVLNVEQNSFVSRNLILAGNCENGLPVSIAIGSLRTNLNCSQNVFSSTIDLSTIADGSIVLAVTQTDKVGLGTTEQFNLIKDTVAPNVDVLAPANSSSVTSPIQLSGICETGLNLTIEGTGVTSALTLPCVNSAFASSINLVSGSGVRAINISQTDKAGNTKTIARSYQATVPSVPPLVTSITAPAVNSYAKSGVTLQGNCQNGVPVVISGSGVAATTNATCTNGTYTAAVNFSAGDGVKVVQVKQTDSTNNSGQDSRSFMRDSVAPALLIASPAANSVFKGAVALTGSCESGLSVNISGHVSSATSANCSNGVFAANITLSAGDGTKNITLNSSDAAGNVTTVSRSFVLDTIAPVIAISSPNAGTSGISGLTISGSCENNLSVTVSGSGTKSAASKVCTGSSFSIEVVFSDGDGTKMIGASQTDAAGNIGSSSRSFTRTSPEPVLDGVALYSSNCAVCHGALASSTKLGRTSSQISTAILTVPSMSSQGNLVNLSNAQVVAIANVLNSNTSNSAVDCSQPTMRGAAKASVRRLNKTELSSVLNSVINWYYPALSEAIQAYPDLQYASDITTYSQIYSQEQIERWAFITDLIAVEVRDQNTVKNARASFGGDCFSKDPITDACWTSMFTNVGAKVYRRPLSTEEVTFLKNQVAGLSTADAVYRAVTVLFRSPDFLFHIETGVSEDTNRVRLSDYEVANRISFSITGQVPDATLKNAAASGSLKTVAQVEAQVRRLLQTEAAKTKLSKFFGEWLQYDHQASPDYLLTDAGAGMGDWTTSFLNADTNRYLVDAFWGPRPATFKEMLSTRTTVFPANDRMQKAYGTSGYSGDGKTAYDSPTNPGLLTRVGILSGVGRETSPIRRGVFIKRRILCDVMPTPDFSVVAQRLDQLSSLTGMEHSNAALTDMRTNATACIGCHSQINPIGFALEAYDQFGKRRSAQTYIDWANMYGTPQVSYYGVQNLRGKVHSLPYPVSGVSIEPNQSMTVNQPADLLNALGESERAMACVSNYVIRNFDRRLEAPADSCAIKEATAALKNGAPVVDVFVKLLANEDIFWRGK